MVKACKNIDAEIFVVDNNSTDGSRDFFSGRFSNVRFIWKNENAGFTKANNEALKLAKGERVLFLNPDTIVPEDCFEKCLSFFESKNKVGALGVHMIDGSGKYLPESKRGFPWLFTSFCKMTGLTTLFPQSKLFARYYLGHLPENEINEVDVLSGAFIMADKKLLDIIGGFDESFFMYAEDIDLSYRIQKAGYKNYYYPETTIVHFKGESTQKQSAGYIRNFYGAMILFIKKHYNKTSSLLYIIFLKAVIALKTLFTRVPAILPDNANYDKVVIAADEKTFRLLKESLQKDFKQITHSEKIGFPEGDNNAFIFCESLQPFKDIIEQMQQYKGHYDFFIHAENAAAVIGSNNKNRSGTVLLLH